jgi:signal transduction histidine kinase
VLLPKVLADRNRTKQVLINLVGNALKFTEQGGVTITFKVDQNSVKTLVADTGKGIPLESQKFLFKKFEQAGTTVLTRDSVRGTGLGLFISKLIIDQMQGHIQLENSQLGVGTTFGFSLPITKSTFVGPPSSAPKRLGEITPIAVKV